MERAVQGIFTTMLLGSSATLFGQIAPGVTILNDRAYRATSPSSLEYQGGQLLFIMFDGAFTDVECGFIPANPLSPPRPCLLYTSPSPRDQRGSRMPSSA